MPEISHRIVELVVAPPMTAQFTLVKSVFGIENYVRPFAKPPRVVEADCTTLFALPLAGAGVSAAEAASQIRRALGGMSPTNLLFLRKIRLVTVTDGGCSVARFVRVVAEAFASRENRRRCTGVSRHTLQ